MGTLRGLSRDWFQTIKEGKYDVLFLRLKVKTDDYV